MLLRTWLLLLLNKPLSNSRLHASKNSDTLAAAAPCISLMAVIMKRCYYESIEYDILLKDWQF